MHLHKTTLRRLGLPGKDELVGWATGKWRIRSGSKTHGISPQREQYLKSLGLPFRDGTCPDVGIIAEDKASCRAGISSNLLIQLILK